MTWTKFSDDFSDDCWTLSDAAFRLHAEGLIWSNRKLLDLRIPKDDLRRFAKRSEAVTELLNVGWWSDDGDAYVIQHHGSYQPTRGAVLNRQTVNTENGKKGGRPRKGVPRERSEMPSTPETQSVSEPLSESRTHRDGTGQDGTGTCEELSEEEISEGLSEYRGGPVAWQTGSAA